ncbi:hypothetical protein GOODEAATRI_003802 [Goodea atripinnis]|uniref:AF4/FMR2 family member lilli n=1 Tax=Goodea atripinnis TaxID=208336 RepID=A0ABV0NJN3_9TELE
MSAPSPDAKPLPVLHSCDQSIDMDTRDTFNRHQLQGSPDISSGSASGVTVCALNIKLSPINPPPPHAKSNNLPSQTFPSLLSSKQAGIVMTQKPTAYVRPMDGQDQVVHKSPELKPSPEHYAPLPELIDKTDCTKTKITPKFLEVNTDAQTSKQTSADTREESKSLSRQRELTDTVAVTQQRAFTYLEAAMFFVESGIAMENDPQISMSSYTMFAETVELLNAHDIWEQAEELALKGSGENGKSIHLVG